MDPVCIPSRDVNRSELCFSRFVDSDRFIAVTGGMSSNVRLETGMKHLAARYGDSSWM